jgi:hypothetical protein
MADLTVASSAPLPDLSVKSSMALPTTPSISAQPEKQPSSYIQALAWDQIPGAKLASDAIDKLHEWANFTQEGKDQHPVQAAAGQFADRLKQMLVGGKGGGLNMETGFLNNPITSSIVGAPEDETINLARGAIKKVGSIATAPFEAAKSTEAARAVTQKLAPETANASVAMTRGAVSTGGAATNAITNADVLNHASQMGVKLTPAQALGTNAARSEQTLGEEALLTGSKIKEAVAAQRSKLEDAIGDFQDKLDPQRVGMTSESAGEHLQNSAEIARSVMKDNVNQAYSDVKAQQSDLAGDVTGRLQDLIHNERYFKQPSAAVERPVLQTEAADKALNDIESSLSNSAMQGRQSIQSLRNLRTNFLEKANQYGANALSDSGQRIYKLAASQVDSAIMDAARGTPFEETFRAAGAQNAKLQELYNQPGSPLYRILNTDDPAKVTDGILNRSSVQEIETLKGENFDLGPLARQAVEDIKSGGYRVTKDGLGGYPDTFLRSLLGPDASKELYMKADIARRLSENYNPSGSGKVLLGASQVKPWMAVAAQAARSRSMPAEAASFLPKVTSPITGGALASPSEMFKSAAPLADDAAISIAKNAARFSEKRDNK